MSSKRNKLIALFGVIGLTLFGATFVSGAGAGFTASDTGQVTIKTAKVSLELRDSNNVGTFDLRFEKLVPGSTVADRFTVKNTGEVPVAVKGSVSGLSGGDSIPPTVTAGELPQLTASIAGYLGATPVAALPPNVNLGTLQPGESRDYDVSVNLASAAGDNWQGVNANGTVTITVESLG